MRRLRWLRNPGYSHLVEKMDTFGMLCYRSPVVYRKEDEGGDGRPVDIDRLNEDFMHRFVTDSKGDARLIWECLGEWIIEE